MLKISLVSGVMLFGMIPQAFAIGCFSGGVAGAAAGHLAHHSITGAVGGCIAGHEYHRHQLAEKDLANKKAYQEKQENYKD